MVPNLLKAVRVEGDRPLPVGRYCLLSGIVPVDRSPILRSLDLCIAGLKWLRSGPRYFDLSVAGLRSDSFDLFFRNGSEETSGHKDFDEGPTFLRIVTPDF